MYNHLYAAFSGFDDQLLSLVDKVKNSRLLLSMNGPKFTRFSDKMSHLEVVNEAAAVGSGTGAVAEVDLVAFFSS